MAELKWENFLKEQVRAIQERREGPPIAQCPDCGCTWFEQIELSQLISTQVILGNKVTPKHSFWVVRCLQCGQIATPATTTLDVPSKEKKLYDELLDLIDKVNKRNKKTE